MAPRQPGRPRKGRDAVTRGDIVELALRVARVEGAGAVTIRGVAARLEVTPMAVSYHMGSRHDMLAALIAHAFEDLNRVPDGTTPAKRVRQMLERYCALCLDNHALILAVLAKPDLMVSVLQNFTDLLRDETAKLTGKAESKVLLNLLVDYTHGFVFAKAAAPVDAAPTASEYLESLDWLMARMLPPA